MATKSILKSIDVRDKHFGRQFVNALERAKRANPKKVNYSRSVKTVQRDKIKDIFG